MIPKKNPKVDLEKYRSLFFLIGLAATLTLSIFVINLKTYDSPDTTVHHTEATLSDDKIIPITKVMPPTPPPPPAPEVIQVVEDKVELEVELDIMSTEADQEDAIDWNEPVEDIGIEEEESDEVLNFELVESVPVFPGCEGAKNNTERKACFQQQIMAFVSRNFTYPEAALQLNIQGRVYVQFVVEKDGSVSNIQILRGVDPILDREAIRVIEALPKIQPAKQRGQPVRMSFVMPISAVVRS